jgi:hypothetical protein
MRSVCPLLHVRRVTRLSGLTLERKTPPPELNRSVRQPPTATAARARRNRGLLAAGIEDTSPVKPQEEGSWRGALFDRVGGGQPTRLGPAVTETDLGE